ncbi:MAG: alpha/beta hydrolase-fold protein [Bacteroidota bacterium]
MNYRYWSTMLLLSFFGTCACAQKPVSFGASYEVASKVLGEMRIVNVLLPIEYADSTEKNYPAIYLLDGAADEDFFHVASLVRYFETHGMMPPAILVGIANVDRKRDFTYPSKDPRDIRDFPTTGGSAKFIDFLQNELIDWTEKTFRTTRQRTLIGQSLGGLLATEVLLQHPGIFNDYVIVSPSLWWDSSRLYRELEDLHGQLEEFPERLFVSVGEEYPIMIASARKLSEVFATENTETTFLPLMDEDHNTILHEALYRAFDHWYDEPPARPYHYANAWDGLRLRAGPSLDATIIGAIPYGESLAFTGAQPSRPDTVAGLAGKWVHAGSDLGRGWVFDAYVSPWRVFRAGQSLAAYANRQLILTDSLIYANQAEEEDSAEMIIWEDPHGNQLIEHNRWESCHQELRLTGLNQHQATVTATNWLRLNEFDLDRMTKEPLYRGIRFWEYEGLMEQEEEVYLKITFLNSVLSIRKECPIK